MSELKAYRPRELVMQGRHNEPIYLKSEADKVIAELKARIAELEDELRWRKCCEEMPEIEEGVGEIFLVVVENESNTSPKGSYVTIAELCDGEWYNDVTGNEIEENIEGSDYFYRSKVSHWMPLPKFEEK